MSEITNPKAWLLFDAECSFCSNLASRLRSLLRHYRIAIAPLQTAWVQQRLALDEQRLLSEMRLLTEEGVLYGGTDALIALARQVWWARPICWLARIPILTTALRAAYLLIARHRHCFDGSCHVGTGPGTFARGWLRWFPAGLLSLAAIVLGRSLDGWVGMLVGAFVLFIAAKWITVSGILLARSGMNGHRLLEYLLFWPGMDPGSFCGEKAVPRPAVREWIFAGGKTLFGAALLWAGVREITASHSLIRGWSGMFALVCLLHFGLFHLVSLFWRALGLDAKPIMQSPGLSTSLGDFWGRRWNTAFTDLMHEHFFQPLARNVGARPALFLIFVISGWVHELVISIPARGGYGLPTLYFVIQGLAVLLEHSKFGHQLGLGSGWKGWCSVAAVTATPVFWLFHPAFVHNVILPMLHDIGAT